MPTLYRARSIAPAASPLVHYRQSALKHRDKIMSLGAYCLSQYSAGALDSGQVAIFIGGRTATLNRQIAPALHSYGAARLPSPLWSTGYPGGFNPFGGTAPQDRLLAAGLADMFEDEFGGFDEGTVIAPPGGGQFYAGPEPFSDSGIARSDAFSSFVYTAPGGHYNPATRPGFFPGVGALFHGFSVWQAYTLHGYGDAQGNFPGGLRFGGIDLYDYYSPGEVVVVNDSHPAMQGMPSVGTVIGEVEEAGRPEDPLRPLAIDRGYGEGWSVTAFNRGDGSASALARPKGWSAMQVLPWSIYTPLLNHTGGIIAGGYRNGLTGQGAGGFCACAVAEQGGSRLAFLAVDMQPWAALVRWLAFLDGIPDP